MCFLVNYGWNIWGYCAENVWFSIIYRLFQLHIYFLFVLFQSDFLLCHIKECYNYM